jgi:hypothetical protein
MKKGILLLSTFCCLLISSYLIDNDIYANEFPVYTWGDHLSYNHGTSVIVTSERIYCGTTGGLFYLDREDNSINKLSIINALSDAYITHLGYDAAERVLVIVYLNGNIDILDDRTNEITNLPYLKEKYLPGDKNVYGLTMADGLAYLSTGFGIVVIDYKNTQVKDTYIIGREAEYLKVNDVCIFEDSIYAATDEGLYVADAINPNLVDYNNWSLNQSVPNASGVFTKLLSLNTFMLASQKTGTDNENIIYAYDPAEGWNSWLNFSSEINALRNDFNHVLIASNKNCQMFDYNGAPSDTFSTILAYDCRQDEMGNTWIANYAYSGLTCSFADNSYNYFAPSGPAYPGVCEIENEQGTIWVGSRVSEINDYNRHGLYTYVNGKWTNYNPFTNGSWNNTFNLASVAIDPNDLTHGYGVNMKTGIVEIKNGDIIKSYDGTNSILPGFNGSDFILISGIDYDNNNNLLIYCSAVYGPLMMIDPDGQWYDMGITDPHYSGSLTGDILATSLDQIWMIIHGSASPGIFVYNYNNTPADASDDMSCFVNIVDNTNTFNGIDPKCLEEDLDGNIWVGTRQGVLVYSTPYDVFDKNGKIVGNRPLIPRNDGTNFADFLLDGEEVTCISVDGANRKWIGTRTSGVFLVSYDGLETIHSFNTYNSPLPSNTIIDIGVNSVTGEVLIGTDIGIVSYQEAATTGLDQYEDVYAFPNPVREDYYGDIVITGLVSESFVKITDISGNIVYETTSLGGQAVWNGKNLANERVSTGVYLVFLCNSDGSQKNVTKILFIK